MHIVVDEIRRTQFMLAHTIKYGTLTAESSTDCFTTYYYLWIYHNIAIGIMDTRSPSNNIGIEI